MHIGKKLLLVILNQFPILNQLNEWAISLQVKTEYVLTPGILLSSQLTVPQVHITLFYNPGFVELLSRSVMSLLSLNYWFGTKMKVIFTFLDYLAC